MTNRAEKTHGFETLIKGVSNLGMLLTNLCTIGMLLIIMTNVVSGISWACPCPGATRR